MIFTQFGKDALTAVMAGDTTITFTKMVASNRTDIIIIDGYKEIKYPVIETEPSAMKFDKNTSTAIITGIFNNQGSSVSRVIFMVGLYATCAGALTRDTPTLFCYETFSVGEPLPPFSEGYATRSYSFNTKVADATHAQITMQDGAYALSVDLADLQGTVEEYRLESGIVEATHRKQGNTHYLTVNNAAKNIKFNATALFDYNDTFELNNEVYTAITSNGGSLEPGAFYPGQYVFAFVNHTQKVIMFQHNESIGINQHDTGLLTDYADSLPFGYHICLDTYQNTSDTDKPLGADFFVEIYKFSVNTIFMRAWRHLGNTYEEYRFTKASGTWTRKWERV